VSTTSANYSTIETFSFTAFIVVRSLVALSRTSRWQALVSKETARYAEHFVRYAASHSTLCQLVTKMPDDVYLWLMDHCNAYGMTLHFTLRKRLIEATAHETIRKGVTQIIVLGAGFDSLVLRLHRQYPISFSLRWISQQRKRQNAKH